MSLLPVRGNGNLPKESLVINSSAVCCCAGPWDIRSARRLGFRASSTLTSLFLLCFLFLFFTNSGLAFRPHTNRFSGGKFPPGWRFSVPLCPENPSVRSNAYETVSLTATGNKQPALTTPVIFWSNSASLSVQTVVCLPLVLLKCYIESFPIPFRLPIGQHVVALS